MARVNSIDFFSKGEDFREFWNNIGVRWQEELQKVVKEKIGFEKEFFKKITKRYFHDRDYHALININFLFGHYSLISRIVHLLFSAGRKEGVILQELADELAMRIENQFIKGIQDNEDTLNFQTSLDPYKIIISNLDDPRNFDYVLTAIPKERLAKHFEGVFKAEKVSFPTNEERRRLLVRYDLFDFNPNANYVVLRNEVEQTAYFYLCPEVSLSDFNGIGVSRYLLWKNYKITEARFHTLPSVADFREFRSYIGVFQENNIKVLHSIQTPVLKRWLLSILVNKRFGDFSGYIYKGTNGNFARVETEYNKAGYKSIRLDGPFDFPMVKRDLQTLGVQLEGLSTLRDFSVGKVSFRISIINNERTFTLSIRRTNNEFYDESDVTINGFPLSDLIQSRQLDATDYKKARHERLESFGETSKRVEFKLSDFMDKKEDVEKMRALFDQSKGYSYCIGETGSGKTTLLKAYFSEYFQHYLTKFGTIKKIMTVEAPLEEIDQNFYQIGYDLNAPEELKEIVKATKTSKPDIVVLSETKDEDSMRMVYDEALLHHSVSTIHKADVVGFAQAAVGYAKGLNTLGIDMLSQVNFAVAQLMSKTVNLEKVAAERMELPMLSDEAAANTLELAFGPELRKEIDEVVKTRKVEIIDHRAGGETLEKVNGNPDYQKTFVIYERMFRNEVEAFVRHVVGDRGLVEDTELLSRLRELYQFIGYENTFFAKWIILYCTKKIPASQEGRVLMNMDAVRGMKFEDRKAILEAVKGQIPEREKKQASK